MNHPGKLKFLSLSVWKILMIMFRNSNAIHIRLNFLKMRKLEKMAILIQVFLQPPTHCLRNVYPAYNTPQYLPEGIFVNHLRIINTRLFFDANIFSVIVVNDADMDNNGKVEFSIKQDQPTFGIFSKEGFFYPIKSRLSAVQSENRDSFLIFLMKN